MSVSFYQIMYSGSKGNFEKASDSKSAAIYKLNALAQGAYFQEYARSKYNYDLYNFASDENLVEEAEMPPLSKEHLSPDAILNDLGIYKKLLTDIKLELENPQDELLSKEIERWFLDKEKIVWIENEISALENVCFYAKEKKYVIKYACDY